jgi:hypothetical protein
MIAIAGSVRDAARLVVALKLSDDQAGSWGSIVRIGVIIAISAFGVFIGCTSASKTAERPPESIPEMAKYTINVGKDYWVRGGSLQLCQGATSMNCTFLQAGTHFKIDRLVPNQAPDGRPIFDPYYHVTLDDGRAGYVDVVSLIEATDIDPVAAAAECQRRGPPRLGMNVAQLEATCWGKPNHINRRQTAKGIRDQYVYDGGRYVDLHNGIVTSIDQDGLREARPH